MTVPKGIEKDLARYEALLLSAVTRAVVAAGEEHGAPWVGVALGYHHGLTFGPVLGALPTSDYEEFKDEYDSPVNRFNPAEWDEEIELDDEELEELATRLTKLYQSDEAVQAEARPGRDIHVRVATALRKALLDAGLLESNALVFATEYTQSDWEENVRASNPAEACAAHGL